MRYLSAGESHGPGLTAIIEGLPSNLEVKVENINYQLARRQKGYGRGGRMKIEKDKIKILSGLRFGKTLGSPLTLFIENRDYENWKEFMDPEPPEREGKRVSSPRPGHADLPGILKYRHKDIRNVLERASARETAMRVAVGSIARELLSLFGIQVYSHVLEIGRIKSERVDLSLEAFSKKVEDSPVRCVHEGSEKEMMAEIDRAREEGDSLGGIFEILVTGVPPGLGSHVHWDRKLDGRLAGALMSLQA
ncbi:MAG: chorismate synthase, partial [Candidatus Syntrophonatronum acetioxidans]